MISSRSFNFLNKERRILIVSWKWLWLIDKLSLFVEKEKHRLLIFRFDDLHSVFFGAKVRYHANEISPLFSNLQIHENK